ncbi:hypothetical protein DFS33DRAFT_1274031 [Desarmillaria ectypa]|nr:hypothetical protein DFS33DRAFT_1274031 [Desarmillaria ectypa]
MAKSCHFVFIRSARRPNVSLRLVRIRIDVRKGSSPFPPPDYPSLYGYYHSPTNADCKEFLFSSVIQRLVAHPPFWSRIITLQLCIYMPSNASLLAAITPDFFPPDEELFEPYTSLKEIDHSDGFDSEPWFPLSLSSSSSYVTSYRSKSRVCASNEESFISSPPPPEYEIITSMSAFTRTSGSDLSNITNVQTPGDFGPGSLELREKDLEVLRESGRINVRNRTFTRRDLIVQMQSYMNSNGLKYHIEYGTCKVAPECEWQETGYSEGTKPEGEKWLSGSDTKAQFFVIGQVGQGRTRADGESSAAGGRWMIKDNPGPKI